MKNKEKKKNLLTKAIEKYCNDTLLPITYEVAHEWDTHSMTYEAYLDCVLSLLNKKESKEDENA